MALQRLRTGYRPALQGGAQVASFNRKVMILASSILGVRARSPLEKLEDLLVFISPSSKKLGDMKIMLFLRGEGPFCLKSKVFVWIGTKRKPNTTVQGYD